MKYRIAIVFVFVLIASVHAETAKVWQRYVKDHNKGEASLLPDYSFAGYKNGTEAIPDVAWKVFDVTGFGAYPNDGKCDRAGIQKAIKAAESHGSGIVFFPPGRFLVADQENLNKSLEIRGDNIVLRGSGTGLGGTEIYQKHHFLPKDPTRMWTVPPVFTFLVDHPQGKAHLSRMRKNADKLAKVVQRGGRETFTVTVDNAERLKDGQTVMVCMNNKDANDYYLKGLQPCSVHTEILTNGVSVAEKHTIVSVKGNTVWFAEPLHTDIDPEHGWTVYDYPVAQGWGVEDIHFTGNCPVPFVHHKDFVHDSGYSGIRMEQGKNCWIRRCRFTNMTTAFLASGCMSSSFIMNTIDGNQGHCNFGINWGSHCLIGLCQDLTGKGSFHGPGISHEQVGGVVWRYESVGKTKTEHRCGGPDFHAQFPYCSLWDFCVANFINNGGNSTLLPNHMQDLTFWNFEQIGKKVTYDFWKIHGDEGKSVSAYYGGAKIVFPNYIGYHGQCSELNREHLGCVESFGRAVKPDSLYEAQLKLRLGKMPSWVEAAKQQWFALKDVHRKESLNVGRK